MNNKLNGQTIIYDIITSSGNGDLNYEFVAADKFSTGTYSVILRCQCYYP